MNEFKLEIAVFNYSSALLAEQAGADRLELCENAGEGGTTPSYGTLKQVKEKIRIPVFPIIRPRGGDFLYTEDEFAIMKSDVALCKKIGFEGVVFGMLLKDGQVNKKECKKLVELAYPMDVTFHRAFDRAADPFQALEDIIDCGFTRILTSGQVPNVNNGLPLVNKLVEAAANRITIMPGSGLRSSNILQIAEATGASEFHSSARTMAPSAMDFNSVTMNENAQSVSVDVEEIQKNKAVLLSLNKSE